MPVQIHAERTVAVRDRRDAALTRPAAVQAVPASVHLGGWTETLNRRPAAGIQLGLQRMLQQRPAAAVQAKLAQTLSGRTIQRASPAPTAAPPAEELLTRAAVAPAAILPDKSQCNICADSDSKKDSKKKDPVQRQAASGRDAATAIPAEAPGRIQVYQRATAGAVMQLIYLWDRSAEEDAPQWSDRTEPPEGYLASGRHNDGKHGEDKLYTRLGSTDLFYGIAYTGKEDQRMNEFLQTLKSYAEENDLPFATEEEKQEAIRSYVRSGNQAPLDVEIMKVLYSGSSGWSHYRPYLERGSRAQTTRQLRDLNPDLPWADEGASLACQVTMVEAIRQDGSVRFLLDGLDNVQGILAGTHHQGKVTSHELKFAMALLDQTVKLSDDDNDEVTPTDGSNVFFYLNHELLTAEQVKSRRRRARASPSRSWCDSCTIL